jgi:hypothetical protein
MIKVKFFNDKLSVEHWLYENQNIDVMSTNLSCSTSEYGSMWCYSIMYRIRESE